MLIPYFFKLAAMSGLRSLAIRKGDFVFGLAKKTDLIWIHLVSKFSIRTLVYSL